MSTKSTEDQLDRYHQKRNFRVTAEPKGRVRKAKAKQLKFVVQEHHASHLHYDFRLEWNGVLKSWSVPKGPVMNRSERRLAVEVEDHPLGYEKFQGVIPGNQYGAGIVYRWDFGTWEPNGDVEEGLARGHLDFKLKGKRLSGRWSLVRFRPNESKPQWLLFYRGEGKAKDETDATEAAIIGRDLPGHPTRASKTPASKTPRRKRR